ncbi:uroporphyrinogen-III C-methyltransferase [Ostreibacterium oceani]|uniref:uroporphyrinogen-III C-methyltransferase n=1 Tax=Ostreibacterium oceani TaxID=2654998 RepID=A0A6N7EUX7_9GAMM|nr:uroporphyrinogen-III C-methyltransferase [Ostreibacterium oceani]MPV86371.1 uroporphyrinogen-III C-methyltransferase [Ostreibacterium oceani]
MTVTIVGAGPGNPDYLTLRGYQCLQRAEVILYDALIDFSGFKALFPVSAKTLFVGKRYQQHAMTQAEINTRLIDYAHQGKSVVRLKGGDGFVFGRGGEEALALKAAGIAFEIVPGMSALNAVTGLAGIPVTHRGVSNQLIVVEGASLLKKTTQHWRYYANCDGTLLIYMGLRCANAIATKLIAHGAPRVTPVAIVLNGSMANQQTLRYTLETLAQASIEDDIAEDLSSAPGLIVIGDVAAMALASERGLMSRIPAGLLARAPVNWSSVGGIQRVVF